ncbi:hypothetical protein AVEN_222205-1 [Araneus ventricosus]|uniref:Uncharacterized protein n=1 Tax=Araneus ventricosus TaxID=182803 RepID=A0A4Y2EXC2_ARAVE|nr:hypothetical protein AVEN_222205-1 [Araneus ventricosus]
MQNHLSDISFANILVGVSWSEICPADLALVPYCFWKVGCLPRIAWTFLPNQVHPVIFHLYPQCVESFMDDSAILHWVRPVQQFFCERDTR